MSSDIGANKASKSIDVNDAIQAFLLYISVYRVGHGELRIRLIRLGVRMQIG